MQCCNEQPTWVENVVGKGYHFCKICRNEVVEKTEEELISDIRKQFTEAISSATNSYKMPIFGSSRLPLITDMGIIAALADAIYANQKLYFNFPTNEVSDSTSALVGELTSYTISAPMPGQFKVDEYMISYFQLHNGASSFIYIDGLNPPIS